MNGGGKYLLWFKNNAGNKQLKEFIEYCFNPSKNLGIEILSQSILNVDKGQGCIYSYQIDLLLGNIIPEDIKCVHEQVNTIVKYTQKSQKTNKSGKLSKAKTTIRYFISSLPCCERSLEQIKYSLLDYWSIEAQHGVLDNPPVFEQDSVQSCHKFLFSNKDGISKFVFNFLTWQRQQLNANKKQKRHIKM